MVRGFCISQSGPDGFWDLHSLLYHGNRCYFQEIKLLGRGGANVKNAWRNNSTSPICVPDVAGTNSHLPLTGYVLGKGVEGE